MKESKLTNRIHELEEEVNSLRTLLKEEIETKGSAFRSLNIEQENLKSINKNLEEQKKKFETIFKTTRVGLAIIDLDGYFLEINNFYLNMLGYTSNELKNTSCLELTVLEDQERMLQTLQDAYHGQDINDFEKRCRTKHGSDLILKISLSLMSSKKHFLVSAQNVTDYINLNKALVIANKHAELSNKTKSEFLANMSHEIRTPMNSVIGMTDLALDKELDSDTKNYVSKANTAAKNLLGIINDILDFSKLEAKKLELSPIHFELKDIISSTLQLTNVAAKDKDLAIKIKLDPKVPKIYYGDSLRLSQVLTNLASNAVKFSHTRGNVVLDISLIEENDKEALVKFSVTDEGIGISKENQSKLFSSFSQADGSTQRTHGGTGLGLAISKAIIELMGGSIWVESKESKGSTFSFKVKLEKSNKENIAATTQDTKKAMKLAIEKLQGKEILLVEDNEMNQELALDLLEKNGLVVTLAENGQEALDILETHEFDLVLMDIQMPVMDGYEATQKIREQERFKNLPIIAMTANVMVNDVAQAKEAGMDDHIGKPIVPHEMFVTMAKWV